MDIIDRINGLLAANGKTGAEMSRELGLSNSVYSQWNTRKTRPSKKSIASIAAYLDTTAEYLIFGDNEKEVPTTDGTEVTVDTLAIIKRIELRLIEIGMSKSEFYRRSGISSASYSQWNTGRFNPSNKKIHDAAECLGISEEYLVNGVDGSVTTGDSMFNSVQYVRDICQQRKIPIYQLEKECGFANGYLNPKKMTKIPYERAKIIGEYLGISSDTIMDGTEKTPTPQGAKSDILDEIDVDFYGDYKKLTEDDKETIRAMARLMRERRAKRQE